MKTKSYIELIKKANTNLIRLITIRKHWIANTLFVKSANRRIQSKVEENKCGVKLYLESNAINTQPTYIHCLSFMIPWHYG